MASVVVFIKSILSRTAVGSDIVSIPVRGIFTGWLRGQARRGGKKEKIREDRNRKRRKCTHEYM